MVQEYCEWILVGDHVSMECKGDQAFPIPENIDKLRFCPRCARQLFVRRAFETKPEKLQNKSEVLTFEKTVTKRITTQKVCAECNKLIKTASIDKETRKLKSTEHVPIYWKVSGYHNEWGNDSPDSIISASACSHTCAITYLTKFLDDPDNCEYLSSGEFRIEADSTSNIE